MAGRIRVLTAVVVCCVALAAPTANAGASAARNLAGRWTGVMHATGRGSLKPYPYTVTISANGRNGTWSLSWCSGTLRLVGHHAGYAIFEEHLTYVARGRHCLGNGRDHLQRRGNALFDHFASPFGPGEDSTGLLHRA